jgi:HEAT repeat protein
LGELGAAEAVDPLIDVLAEPDPVLRARTVTALGQIGGDKALEALLPMLQDPDQLVREMTASVLGRLGDSQAIPALQAAAQVEQKDYVRQAMNEAIEMLE